MPQVGYTLWYLTDTAELGEYLPSGHVAPLPPDTIVLRAIYLSEFQTTPDDLARARQWLTQEWPHLLKVVPSTDGPPFRSALVYVRSNAEQVPRVSDWRLAHALRPEIYGCQAIRYQVVRVGSNYPWETEGVLGRQGFFLTGSTAMSALWRVTRIEADALEREVLTLAPVRLAHGLAAPDFETLDPPLRDFLKQNFDAFQKAVAGTLYLDVVDRANSLAEGILAYCLTLVGHAVPRTLFERIEEARRVLADPNRPATFPMTGYGLVLADRIRLLHQRTHADRATQGQPLRPEVGMSAAIEIGRASC